MTITDRDLWTTLQEILGTGVRNVQRSPSAYRSSYHLEVLAVQLDDGRVLRLMFKELGPAGLLDGARDAKPEFLCDPSREIQVYRHLLDSEAMGTAFCHGAVSDAQGQYHGLILEKVEGTELYQVGDFAIWQQTARWLAQFHVRMAETPARDEPVPLIPYGRNFYHRWFERAIAFGHDLRRWTKGYRRVVERLLDQPRVVLHGDFYPSNILVADGSTGLRICPIDWELASWGPGVIDLAALTAGNWSPTYRERLAHAYFDALPTPGSWDDFLAAFDDACLYLAVQWLGWSANWLPPREHAHDWRREFLELAQRLEL